MARVIRIMRKKLMLVSQVCVRVRKWARRMLRHTMCRENSSRQCCGWRTMNSSMPKSMVITAL